MCLAQARNHTPASPCAEHASKGKCRMCETRRTGSCCSISSTRWKSPIRNNLNKPCAGACGRWRGDWPRSRSNMKSPSNKPPRLARNPARIPRRLQRRSTPACGGNCPDANFWRRFFTVLRVESQGINEADAASGAPGDIMCHAEDGKILLAIEVKDRELTLTDTDASIRKSRQSGDSLSNLLFAAPRIRQHDQDSIETSIQSAWATGLNIYHVDIVDFATHGLVLLDESWRPKFLREIGRELDTRGDPVHRRAWNEILKNFAI